MPLYQYQCIDPECGHVDSFVDSMTTDRAPHYPCSMCNGIARRVYEPPQLAIFTPYRTPHFDGVMREVRTARQEDELCRRNNCSRLLSTDWLDPEKSRKKREKEADAMLPPMEESYRQAKHELGLGSETTVDDLPGSKRRKPELVSTTP